MRKPISGIEALYIAHVNGKDLLKSKRQRKKIEVPVWLAYIFALSFSLYPVSVTRLPYIQIGLFTFGGMLLIFFCLPILKEYGITLKNGGLLFSFIIVHLFFYFISINEAGTIAIIRVIAVVIFYFVITNFRLTYTNQENIIKIIVWSSTLILAVLVYMNYFIFHHDVLSPYFIDVENYKTFKNQPPFFAATFFPFAFAIMLEKKRYWYGAVIIIYSIAIIYSNSRASLIAEGLSIILFFILPNKQRQQSRINIYRVVGILLVVFSIMLSSFLEKQIENYNKTKGTDSFVDFEHHYSEKERLRFIKTGLSEFIEQPFGHGLGTFREAIGEATHNDYILVLYEMGIFGIIIFVVLLGYFVKVLFVLRKYVPEKQLWFWNASLVSLLVLYAQMNMNNTYNTIVLWYLFANIEIFRKNIMAKKDSITTV